MGSQFVINAICFVAGSIAGGLAVGMIFGKEYQKKIRDLQDEVNYLRDKNRSEKHDELKKREEKVAKEEVEQDLHSVINTLGYSHEASEEKEEEKEDEKPEQRSKEQREEDIYMIDADEAKDDMPYVESETLTYYQEDNILADALNDKIENGGALLGDDCMEKLASTDEEYVYVRDDAEEKIWEIIVDHDQSFYRDVLGIS